MAGLGPQKLELKRKRDDEAPETLMRDIDHSDSPKAKIPKTHVPVWRLVRANDAPPLPIQPGIPIPRPAEPLYGVAAIKVTTPGEEKRNPYALPSLAQKEAKNDAKNETALVAAAVPNRVIARAAPRKYHLSRSSAPVSASGSEKRKRDVAVFEERRVRQKVPDDTKANIVVTNSHSVADERVDFEVITKDEQHPEQKPKNPTLREGEKEWRKERWATAREAQAEPAQPTDDLAKFNDLQKQVEADEQSSKTTRKTIKPPRAPPKRWHERHPEAMDIDQHNGPSEHDFVIDTYVRELVPIVDLTAHDTSAVGHLVIPEEDEELWEFYAGDESDEENANKEFDTDEDDSNAEDYYAADYPEDEVSTDDEFDVEGAAYKHRINSSDTEQFDLDDVVGSDDGEDAEWSGGMGESEIWSAMREYDGAGTDEM